MSKDLTPETNEEYTNSRNHNITLASFTMAVIGLVASRQDLVGSNLQYGLSYLSVAMFCFFIGLYMYIFRQKKNKYPYVGETLEFVGIIALGIGFFYLITQIVPGSISLEILYLGFLAVLVLVAVIELRINRQFFR